MVEFWLTVAFGCLACLLSKTSAVDELKFPAPNTPSNRILGFILAFNFDHIDPLVLILSEYLAMCESGWNPSIILFTTSFWSDTLRRYIKSKTFCYRLNTTYSVEYEMRDPSIGISLGAEHRKTLYREVNNYDMFVYHEDDIIFKHSHLVAYLYETQKLHNLLPENGLREYNIGFQRYRKLARVNEIHHDENWGEQDIFEQELLEEVPNFRPICIEKVPYIKVDGNTHQAIWALTRDQVLLLQKKCNFMNMSSPSREHMSSLSLYDRHSNYCALTKILPATGLTTFSIYHYYQQRHISWIPVFTSDENIRAGYHFAETKPKIPEQVPDCWDGLVAKSRQEQESSGGTNPPA